MAAQIQGGPRTWSGSRDSEGHREYKISYLIRCDVADGPSVALTAPGLPQPGQLWVIGNDIDIWAYCKKDATIKPMQVQSNEPNTFFEIEFTFTTKPETGEHKVCSQAQIENPLLQPQKVSGGFTKLTTEATFDRFGRPMLNSAFELLHGPELEVDYVRPTVEIEQNVAVLGLEIFAPMLNCLNSLPLWGCPPRSVKLTNATWEKKYYGVCFSYYTRKFSFEVSFNGYDKYLIDVGTKALNGKWNNDTGLWQLVDIGGSPPDPSNPQHYNRFTDKKGNIATVLLDGAGQPYNPTLNQTVECYFSGVIASPKFWRVAGFNRLCVLEYIGDCQWAGDTDEDPSVHVILDASQSTPDYEGLIALSRSDSPFEYFTPADSWVPMGPNVMITTDENSMVTLTTGSSPGGVGFSFYNEVNFYLLGIPLVL